MDGWVWHLDELEIPLRGEPKLQVRVLIAEIINFPDFQKVLRAVGIRYTMNQDLEAPLTSRTWVNDILRELSPGGQGSGCLGRKWVLADIESECKEFVKSEKEKIWKTMAAPRKKDAEVPTRLLIDQSANEPAAFGSTEVSRSSESPLDVSERMELSGSKEAGWGKDISNTLPHDPQSDIYPDPTGPSLYSTNPHAPWQEAKEVCGSKDTPLTSPFSPSFPSSQTDSYPYPTGPSLPASSNAPYGAVSGTATEVGSKEAGGNEDRTPISSLDPTATCLQQFSFPHKSSSHPPGHVKDSHTQESWFETIGVSRQGSGNKEESRSNAPSGV